MARIIGSFEDLEASVERTACLKARDKVDEARRRVQTIIKDAYQEAEQVEAETLEEARRQADEKRRERLTEAAHEAKRRRLMAREEVLGQAWDQAESELRRLVDRDEYAQVLRRLAWQAVQTLGAGRIALATDSKGQDLMTGELLTTWGNEASEDFGAPVEFERASEPLDTWGGLVASKEGGRKRMDARFSSRLETARSELRDAVFHRLMGES